MFRHGALSLAAAVASQLWLSGLAVAQDATTPPPEQPPAAEPAPALPPPEEPAAPPAAEPAPPTVAEPAPAAEDVVTEAATPRERTEEIVVTGTRIRRKDLTTPAPVSIISREQIQASGKVSIGDFLQALPEQGNAINTQFNNGGNGATRVSLRGMGTGRTLVLLNGRRFVPGGSDVGPDDSVDLNSIPTEAIERVEILKDGASAIYGADAVAGVVNLITRKGFSGSSVSAYGGISQENDGGYTEINATSGTSGDRGSLLFSAGYATQNETWAGDRSWSNPDKAFDYLTGEVSLLGSSAIPTGRFTLPTDLDAAREPIPQTCPPGADPLCQLVRNDFPAYTGNNFLPDSSAPHGFRPYDGSIDQYNYQPENYLVTPLQRLQLFATGDGKLYGDVARAYFEASYVNRQSSQKLAPEPLFTSNAGVTISADSFYNPFGVDITDSRRRLVEFGNRNFSQDFDTFRVVGGIDGTLPDIGPLTSWFWDTNINYGRTAGTSTTQGTLRAPLVQAAVGPSFLDATDNIVKCGTPGNVIAGCTPLNLFGGAGSITPEQVAGLGFTGPDRIMTDLKAVQVNTGGPVFTLVEDRPVAVALGYEYRELTGSFTPNPISAAFENTGNNSFPTSGGYNVHEVYGEVSVPIVSALPYAQLVEATLAARWFDYNTFGSDATYKVGARWQIIPDVAVRGTYSTAFRAPSISELYSGSQESFPTAIDPCAGVNAAGEVVAVDPGSTTGVQCLREEAAIPGSTVLNNGDDRAQLPEILGGNPNLDPETANIYTVGLVWEPRWVKNLSVTFDYYSIDLSDAITPVGAGTVLQGCYQQGDQSFCNQIHRTPEGLIDFIDDPNVNVGSDKTAGLDLGIRYSLPSPFGRFGFGFDGTWLQKYDRTLATGQVLEGKGTYDLITSQDGGVYPAYKFNTGVTWGLRNLGAGVNLRYIGSFKECGNLFGANGQDGLCYVDQTANLGVAQVSHRVKAWTNTDAFVSYSMRSGLGNTGVAVGVNNVFNTDPAVVYNGFLASSDAATYDYMGRYYYARLTHNF